jgi:hypothetical protein
VAKDGDFTRVTMNSAGTAKLVIAFSVARIGSTSARCTDGPAARTK